MILYHGTTVPNIKQFRLGVTGIGELSTPVKCIWLTDTFKAAENHVINHVKHQRNATQAYVYEVQIASDAIIADSIKRKEIPRSVNKKIVCSLSGYLFYLSKKHDWLSAIGCAIGEPGYVAFKNFLFETLLDAGVHLLANPAFVFSPVKGNSEIILYGNPGSHVDYALLDVKKATILKRTQVY